MLSLAIRTASSSSRNVSTVSTGPNDSSWTHRHRAVAAVEQRWAGSRSRRPARGRRAGSRRSRSVAPSAIPRATYASTLSRCAAEISGPVSALSSNGPPSRISSARRTSSSTNSSWIDSSTTSRAPAEHTWPECRNTAVSAKSSAASRSASANTMLGFLPPSSRATFFTVAAAEAMIRLPVARPPVKETRSTRGVLAEQAHPRAAPAPSTRLATPAGTPASVEQRPSAGSRCAG